MRKLYLFFFIILNVVLSTLVKSQDYSMRIPQHKRTFSDTIKGIPSDTFSVDGMLFKMQLGKKYKPPFFPKVVNQRLVFVAKRNMILNLQVTGFAYNFEHDGKTTRGNHSTAFLKEFIQKTKLNVNEVITISQVSCQSPEDGSINDMPTPFSITRIK